MTESRLAFPQWVGESELIGFNSLGEGVYFDQELQIRFALTYCCQSARTGVSVTEHNKSGIACKGCYNSVPHENTEITTLAECATCGERDRSYWTNYCHYA